MQIRPVLETLEDRIAPATLAGTVTSSTFTYTDIDGDAITVKFSKSVLTEDNAEALFAMTEDSLGHSLDSIDLSALGWEAGTLKGLNITITSKKVGDGDGLVNIGAILGDGIDLGTVTVDGALAMITAGDDILTTRGLKTLKVGTLGLADDQSPDSLDAVTSLITGGLGTLTVSGDINQAYLSIIGDEALVNLKTAAIGGSLIGGDYDYSGSVRVDGFITKITVGGDLAGHGGQYSGSILATGNIATVTVKGDITGGNGMEGYSGIIHSDASIGTVTVRGDIRGGAYEHSGAVIAEGNIAKATVTGSLFGGEGDYSGTILAGHAIKKAEVKSGLFGGDGSHSGSVISTADYFAKAKGISHVGGGENSGIFLEPSHPEGTEDYGTTLVYTDVDGDIVTVKFSKKIAAGENADGLFSFTGQSLDSIDLSQLGWHSAALKGLNISITARKATGGDGLVNVGAILAEGIDLGTVTVDGALAKITAGDGFLPTKGLKTLKVGTLGLADGMAPDSTEDVTSIIVGGLYRLTVADNINYAYLSIVGDNALVNLKTATIGGSIIGGDDDYSGSLRVDGFITKITVGGDLKGGNGQYSGSILSIGNIAMVTVKGDIVGGDGEAGHSGIILSDSSIGTVTVGGDILGGGYTNSGAVLARGNIAKATVTGNIIGGDGGYSGIVQAEGDILSVSVLKDIKGGEGAFSGMINAYSDIHKARVKGDIVGGDGFAAGRVQAGTSHVGGGVLNLEVGGSLITGAGQYTGYVSSVGAIESITVKGNLEGGDVLGGGTIYSRGDINKVLISGQLNGGSGELTGTVYAEGTIANAEVKKGLFGSSGDQSGSVISLSGPFGKVKGTEHAGTGEISGIFCQPVSVFYYTDIDGDAVTVEFNRAILSEKNVAALFSFTENSLGQQLDSIDLSKLGWNVGKLKDLNISITAESANGGDGLVNVGAILGEGIDLGTISVDGALAKIVAGDNILTTTGLKALTVDSLGLADGLSPDSLDSVTSTITGGLETLEIIHDINEALLSIKGNASHVNLQTATVGGSLIGGDFAQSGSIFVDGTLEKITIEGDVIGAEGTESGKIIADEIGSALIKGDVKGGNAEGSGGIYGKTLLSKVEVQGDLIGGNGKRSGYIAGDDLISHVKIGGNITGGQGDYAGSIESNNQLSQVEISGNVVGGSGKYAGFVYALNLMESVTVNGDLQGGSALGTGSVESTHVLNKAVIGGKLIGGTGTASGSIIAANTINEVQVEKGLQGGSGGFSGSAISWSGTITNKISNGPLTPGSGYASGTFYTSF